MCTVNEGTLTCCSKTILGLNYYFYGVDEKLTSALSDQKVPDKLQEKFKGWTERLGKVGKNIVVLEADPNLVKTWAGTIVPPNKWKYCRLVEEAETMRKSGNTYGLQYTLPWLFKAGEVSTRVVILVNSNLIMQRDERYFLPILIHESSHFLAEQLPEKYTWDTIAKDNQIQEDWFSFIKSFIDEGKKDMWVESCNEQWEYLQRCLKEDAGEYFPVLCELLATAVLMQEDGQAGSDAVRSWAGTLEGELDKILNGVLTNFLPADNAAKP